MNEFLPLVKAPKHPISHDGLRILRDIFSDSSFNGYILLAKKGENGFREICYIRQNDLVDYLARLECYTRTGSPPSIFHPRPYSESAACSRKHPGETASH